jgi:hypothetical protein
MTDDKGAQRCVVEINSFIIFAEVSLVLKRAFDSGLSLICHLLFVISSPV